MRLARKLTLALALGILAVMGLYAVFQVRQEIELSEDDLLRAQRVGRAWLGTIESVWDHEGSERAHELVRLATQRAHEIELRILSLDAATVEAPLSAEERATLLSGKRVRRERQDPRGMARREVFVPMKTRDGPQMIVEYVEPAHHTRAFIRMSHLGIGGATLAIVVVCGAIASILHYLLVGRPLEMLRDKARRAGEGDFSRPLELTQDDEMGELAGEVNAMCERIDAANRRLAEETEARIDALDQLRHTDRLATVGQLAAGVAHELGSPLSVVSARAELIGASELPRSDVVKNARLIGEQCDRMTAIIQQLLDFSRRRGSALGVTDLRSVLARTSDLLSTAADRARVRLHTEVPDAAVFARVDRNQMQQALANIVLNGIQAMPDGGVLSTRVATAAAQPPAGNGTANGHYARITVEDQGTGIQPDHLERIFEPFFTTKGVGEGTGLGLAVARGIVAEHGGWIEVESTMGRGTRFLIWLPLAEAGGAGASGAA